MVEYEDGEPLDNGDGGFTVWTSRGEAQDEMDSACAEVPLKIVEYREMMSEAPNA